MRESRVQSFKDGLVGDKEQIVVEADCVHLWASMTMTTMMRLRRGHYRLLVGPTTGVRSSKQVFLDFLTYRMDRIIGRLAS